MVPLLFLYHRLPFIDWRTPVGYLIALLCESLAVYVNVLCAIPCICSIIGTCWIAITCVKDVANDLPSLTIDNKRSLQNRKKVKEHFCNFVQSYLDLKELSENKFQIFIHYKKF